ncbi:unnamed protein product [Rodentolepis nana]|uniref:DNA polymerase kappa n=1 Tax=Rodentolepis nana TaxID=102285 RepID=A0A3P7SKZ6_RODNA|nr:unnamed protein product [Rodentolepis nana]
MARMRGINLHKAGMEGLDSETINKIIEENSKGSKFYENERRRGAILKEQVEEKLAKLRSLTPSDIEAGEKEADKLLRNFSAERRFDRCIIHIDMDAFYAAVEMRDDPSLRLKPLAVGSQSMLSTSNYLARRYGVRAAMPGFLGKKLCPQLTIVPPDFVKYTEVSRTVRSVLGEYCDGGASGLVVMSLDEVYLNITQHLKQRADWPPDRRTYWPRVAPKTPLLVCKCAKNNADSTVADLLVTSSASNSPSKFASTSSNQGNSRSSTTSSTTACSNTPPSTISLVVGKDEALATCLLCGMLIKTGPRVFGTSAEEAVREMRFRVFCATKLTCSAGIAPNSLIAKIASDLNKPNGQYSIEPTLEAIEAFISSLPIRKVGHIIPCEHWVVPLFLFGAESGGYKSAKVPGIGYVTECKLKAFGVEMIVDLWKKRGALYHLTSPTAMHYYMRITLGHCEDEWAEGEGPHIAGFSGHRSSHQKSMSTERTFQDCSDMDTLLAKCRKLCVSLVKDMNEAHVKGKTVTMKLKLDTFEVRSRSQTLPDYTCSIDIIFQCASEILKDEVKAELANNSKALTLRLMGVKISNLVPSAMCQQFRQETLESAFDRGFKGAKDEEKCEEIPNTSIPETTSSIITTVKESTSANEDNEFSTTVCPVCSKELKLKDLEQMNDHLDTCLSRQTVLEAVQETFTSPQPSTSKPPSVAVKRPARPTGFGGPLDKYFRIE